MLVQISFLLGESFFVNKILFPFVYLNGSFLAAYLGVLDLASALWAHKCMYIDTDYSLTGRAYMYLSDDPGKMKSRRALPYFSPNGSVIRALAEESRNLGSSPALSIGV